MKNLAPVSEAEDLPTKGQIDFAASGGGTDASTPIQNNYAYAVGDFFYQGQTVFRVVGAFTSPPNATTTTAHLVAANVEVAGRLFTDSTKSYPVTAITNSTTINLTPADDNLYFVLSGSGSVLSLTHTDPVLKGKSFRISVRYTSDSTFGLSIGTKFEGLPLRPAGIDDISWVTYEYHAFAYDLYLLVSTTIAGNGSRANNARTTIISGSNTLSNATANALSNISGLMFYAIAGVTYRFSALLNYTANATTTGSRFTLAGPATSILAYKASVPLTATGDTLTNANAYGLPAASNATSAFTSSNIATIQGIIRTTVTDYVFLQFASEVAGAGNITVQAGSTLEVW